MTTVPRLSLRCRDVASGPIVIVGNLVESQLDSPLLHLDEQIISDALQVWRGGVRIHGIQICRASKLMPGVSLNGRMTARDFLLLRCLGSQRRTNKDVETVVLQRTNKPPHLSLRL